MRFFAAFLGMALAVVGSVVGHVLAYDWFRENTCARTDRPSSFPADASIQGWVCGVRAEEWWAIPGVWVLGVSAFLTVALVVTLWIRGGGWPILSPVVLVAVPLLSLLLLGTAPDTCSDNARRTNPSYACWTHPNR